jgi:hypothetical protein
MIGNGENKQTSKGKIPPQAKAAPDAMAACRGWALNLIELG